MCSLRCLIPLPRVRTAYALTHKQTPTRHTLCVTTKFCRAFYRVAVSFWPLCFAFLFSSRLSLFAMELWPNTLCTDNFRVIKWTQQAKSLVLKGIYDRIFVCLEAKNTKNGRTKSCASRASPAVLWFRLLTISGRSIEYISSVDKCKHIRSMRHNNATKPTNDSMEQNE